MSKRLIFVISIFAVSFARGETNLLDNFSIRHCSDSKCLIATGTKAYVSFNGRTISAREVQMEIRGNGRWRKLRCSDFHADLVANRFVCEEINISYLFDNNLDFKAY